jgi:5-deoxy-glucuronate isomerase
VSARDLTRPGDGPEVLRVDPESAGWGSLGYSVYSLEGGESLSLDLPDRELALVTISGRGHARVAGGSFHLGREGVFVEMSPLLYVPPGSPLDLSAEVGEGWTFAVGSAPAVGRHPLRLVEPEEVEVEIRGGGAALRQVSHVLAPPLPAERLIVYEVVVPAGSWAGWPPHCHDGEHGSPYLEETYYLRFDRPEGFAFHRNYLGDGSFDEVFTVGDGECVSVPRGFHVTTAAPGANMWILNFLAGELVDGERATPPFFDPETTWITEDWSGGQIRLPAAVPAAAGPGAVR